MKKIIKSWYDPEFKDEVGRLYTLFLNFCLLWGLIFGDHKKDEELTIDEVVQFTGTEFPKRHPESRDFQKVFSTLLCVAVIRENGELIIRPEINTIFTYYSEGKHDLITPIILALEKDCRAQAYIWINQQMN